MKMRSYRICVFIIIEQQRIVFVCLPLLVPEQKTVFLRISCARAFQPFSGPFAGHFVS